MEIENKSRKNILLAAVKPTAPQSRHIVFEDCVCTLIRSDATSHQLGKQKRSTVETYMFLKA